MHAQRATPQPASIGSLKAEALAQVEPHFCVENIYDHSASDCFMLRVDEFGGHEPQRSMYEDDNERSRGDGNEYVVVVRTDNEHAHAVGIRSARSGGSAGVGWRARIGEHDERESDAARSCGAAWWLAPRARRWTRYCREYRRACRSGGTAGMASTPVGDDGYVARCRRGRRDPSTVGRGLERHHAPYSVVKDAFEISR